tara:strand:- start:53 stop:226 length:174 start_codon:yes stop_codon:yes gene_type:complete
LISLAVFLSRRRKTKIVSDADEAKLKEIHQTFADFYFSDRGKFSERMLYSAKHAVGK